MALAFGLLFPDCCSNMIKDRTLRLYPFIPLSQRFNVQISLVSQIIQGGMILHECILPVIASIKFHSVTRQEAEFTL